MYLINDQIKRIVESIEFFKWKREETKIKLKILKANKEDGGIALMDIRRLFIEASMQ